MKKPMEKGGRKMPPKAKRDERETMPEGDAAPKRADRPARKRGGSVKDEC